MKKNIALIALVVVMALVSGCNDKDKSPIEGISIDFYNEGMEIIDSLQTEENTKAIMSVMSASGNGEKMEILQRVDDLVSKAKTEEEELFGNTVGVVVVQYNATMLTEILNNINEKSGLERVKVDGYEVELAAKMIVNLQRASTIQEVADVTSMVEK